MNVAHSANAQATKAGAGMHHAKGQAGLGGLNTGDQGFMALFSALDSDADDQGLLGAGKDGLAALGLGGATADSAAAASLLPPTDPLALAAQAAQTVAQGVTGGAATAGTDAANASAGTDVTRAMAALDATAAKDAGTAAQPQGAGADGDAVAQAGETVPAASAATAAAHASTRPDSELMKALKAQLQAADANTQVGTDASGTAGAARAAADAQTAAAGSTATPSNKPSDVQLADTKLAAQLRLADTGRQADALAQKAPGAESLMLAAVPDGAVRDAQRALERGASPAVSASADSGTPGQGFAVTHGAIIEKPSASVDVLSPQATPDVQVAEQVSYWVSKDVQNAELKLDGLGAKPVEVSISVVGQEARVEFRTDQPEIRQVLENAMPHLKEMLQSEGLTLAGTTVGTSAQGDQASSQEQRGRAEARQARIALASLAPGQAGRAVESGMGSAVDYFV